MRTHSHTGMSMGVMGGTNLGGAIGVGMNGLGITGPGFAGTPQSTHTNALPGMGGTHSPSGLVCWAAVMEIMTVSFGVFGGGRAVCAANLQGAQF
jgi:hypothetical protein